MTVSDEIIKVLDYLCEKIGIVIDWTNDNVLVYLEELCSKYINYEIATSVVNLIFHTVLLIISFLIIKHIIKIFRDEDDKYSVDHKFFAIIGGGAFLFLALPIGFINVHKEIFDIITCLTIPEKMLIEYAHTLINSNLN